MELFDKFTRQLEIETRTVTQFLQTWWGGLDEIERLLALCIMGASLLVLALGRPRTANMVDMSGQRYKRNNRMQFFGALTVILVFSLGLDIVADRWR